MTSTLLCPYSRKIGNQGSVLIILYVFLLYDYNIRKQIKFVEKICLYMLI